MNVSFDCKPVKIEVAPLYAGYPIVTIWCRGTLELGYTIQGREPDVGIFSDWAEYGVTGSDIEWTSDNLEALNPDDACWYRLTSPHTDILNKLAYAHEDAINSACIEDAEPDPDEMRDRMRDAAE